MTPQIIFFIFIGILIFEFLFESLLNYQNSKHYNDPIPKKLEEIYDKETHLKSQNYNTANYWLYFWSSLFRLLIVLIFFFLDGFLRLHSFVTNYSDNQIIISLLFLGSILLFNFLIGIPSSYYRTFIIEENFGFNKTTKKIFLLDKLKILLLMLLIFSISLTIILLIYYEYKANFWLYTWGFTIVFSLFLTLFYSTLIVPVFNKQTPLEDGKLKNAIQKLASKVGFRLDNIYIIDNSKRSTKANAYFSGFGPKKRIVLYDTLIDNLETDEIISVLAHEIGHYQKKHSLYSLLLGTITIGINLYFLALLIDSQLIALALGLEAPNFHIGLIAFLMLYSPFSTIINILRNMLSRKFEYQADAFAKNNYIGESLTSALKKLTKDSLSNLTPHPTYVFINYSHPTLLQRINKLEG